MFTQQTWVNEQTKLSSWRVAQAFDLAGITNTVGTQFLRVFCEEPALSLSKGRASEMPAPSGFDHVSTTKRDHITPQLKKKEMKWNGWHAFRRGLATNLHEMGVPTKVIQRVCRHADEATTKKHYIHAAEPGARSGMRKLEASITREKYDGR